MSLLQLILSPASLSRILYKPHVSCYPISSSTVPRLQCPVTSAVTLKTHGTASCHSDDCHGFCTVCLLRLEGLQSLHHSSESLESLLVWFRGVGFLPESFPSFEELADAALLNSICSNPFHVLRHYFMDKKPPGHNLCPRAHSFALPNKDSCNLVSRSIYMYGAIIIQYLFPPNSSIFYYDAILLLVQYIM